MKSLSRVQLFVIPWTVVYQASLSMGFSRQEYWSGEQSLNCWTPREVQYFVFLNEQLMVASLVAQTVKNPPTMQETQVRSLGWEDPLEKEMATIPVLLPGKSQGQRSLVDYSPWDHKESETTE